MKDMTKEKPTAVDWNAPLTEEEKAIAARTRRSLWEQRKGNIERAKQLEPLLNATVMGVWGHRTGNGAREYAVFKRNDEDTHFVVIGRDEQGNYQTRPINPDNTPNQMKVRTVDEYIGNPD